MLGKASEGAWIRLGLSLARLLSPDQQAKVTGELEDAFIGIGKKVLSVLKLYEKLELRGALEKSSGARLQDLRNTVVWADSVRESRNSIHFGANRR
jgi:hypothetical protein